MKVDVNNGVDELDGEVIIGTSVSLVVGGTSVSDTTEVLVKADDPDAIEGAPIDKLVVDAERVDVTTSSLATLCTEAVDELICTSLTAVTEAKAIGLMSTEVEELSIGDVMYELVEELNRELVAFAENVED